MKKQILKALTLIFALVLVFVLPMSAEDYKTGDMNGDGQVNTDDAIYLLRHVLQPKDYTLSCNHNFEYYEAKAATCTEVGWNAYAVCTRCNYNTYKEIAALDHDEIAVQGKEATCTDSGYTTHLTCSRCDYKSGYSVIPALGHDEISHEAKSSTCTEIGWEAYVTCSRCDYKVGYSEISAKGHNYENRKCTVCGKVDPNAYSEGLKFTSNGNGTCYVSGIGTCTDTDIVIPKVSPSGDKVTSIGSSAFKNRSSLTSVTIPDSVTSIGDYAFYNCTSLTSVTIPDSVTSIENYAFYYCYNLTSMTIPDSVTSIGSYAFYCCYSLTSVTIPDSVTSIGSYAFYWCSSLTSVTIPDGVTSIGSDTFYNCTALEKIYFNATAMNDLSSTNYVFYKAGQSGDGIEVVIGKNVTKIPASLFYPRSSSSDAPKITSVEFEEGSVCTSIGSNAFCFCNSLTSVTIPDSVTSIGSYAFSGCSKLTNVTIGDGVTSIGNYAFSNCKALEKIYFNATAMDDLSSDNYVFSYAGQNGNGIQVVIGKNVTKIPEYLFYPYSVSSYAPKITSVEFEEGSVCTSIGSYAFYYCTSLTSVTIGESVTRIGYNAFYGCNKLAEVINKSSLNITKGSSSYGYVAYYALEVHNGESKIANNNDYLFYTCDNVNYLFGYVGNDTELVLPESYNGQNYEIYKYAFYNCDSLTSVTMPDSVTSIGNSAFSNCTGLTSVYITDIAAWCNISFGSSSANPLVHAKNLYVNNKLVTNLVIPDSVTSIGSYAFYNYSRLTSVTISDSVTSIGDYAFYNCDSLTSVTIGESVTSIGSYAFYDCYWLESVTILDSVTSIGDYAFYNCFNLTSITIPDGVTSIGDYAFYDCHYLTSITIPDSVTSIGYEAFSGCSNLQYNIYDNAKYLGNEQNPYVYLALRVSTNTSSCNIHGQTKLIGGDAFRDYHNLKSITIPDSVTSIGDYAFYACTGLKSITIGNSVTSIGDYAFDHCYNLTSMTIPDSVTSIGQGAFGYCDSLTSVTIPESVTSIGRSAFYDCDSLTSIIFEDTSTWYRTDDPTNWQNMTGGTETSVTSSYTNATNFKSNYGYYNYYWYKK